MYFEKAAWSVHQKECKCLERIAPNIPPEMVRIVARILWRLKEEAEYVPAVSSDIPNRKFERLMSHSADIPDDSVRMENFHNVFAMLRLYLDENDVLGLSDAKSIFGKVATNAFGIMDMDLNPIGTGLYLRLSSLDHSCNPNAVVVFSGSAAVLRPLNKNLDLVADFDKVRISYIDLMGLKRERSKQLEEQYYFTCECEICTDIHRDLEMQGLKCSRNGCPGPVTVSEDSDEGNCLECGKAVGMSVVNEERFFRQKTQWDLEELEEMKKTQPESLDMDEVLSRCKEMLKAQREIFHPTNIFRIRILDKAMDAAKELQQWDCVIKYGLQTLPGYRKFYPEHHPNVILQEAKIAKCLLLMGDLQQANTILRRAFESGKISLGENQPLHKSVEEMLWECEEERKIQLNRKQNKEIVE